MPYNFVADSFHTKKLFSAILEGKRPFCVFSPLFEGFEATYDDHLRLIGKRVVDFLLLFIELFFASCYG